MNKSLYRLTVKFTLNDNFKKFIIGKKRKPKRKNKKQRRVNEKI